MDGMVGLEGGGADAWLDEATGTLVLARMREARAWLADPAQWKDPDRAEAGSPLHAFKPADMNRPGDRDAGIGWMDDPDHARVRAPIQAALARRVGRARPLVEAVVEARLAALPTGRFDAAADYAAPIPVAVIGALLGVDVADYPKFRAWSEAVMTIFDPARSEAEAGAGQAAVEAIGDYLDSAMAARRGGGADDLIGDLLAAQAAGAPLSASEIRVNCFNLLLGGNLTTADLISSGLHLLLANPDQLARLRADPALIGQAVEETLRLEPPTLGAQRVAARAMEVAGCPVHAGQVVAVSIERANRDPAVFPEPDRFDIGRHDGPHLSFGAGAHICIGAALARLEAKVAILALIQRFPRLALADPNAPPAWRPAPYFRGLARLEVAAGKEPRPLDPIEGKGSLPL